MKRNLIVAALAVASLASCGSNATVTAPKTFADSVSVALGSAMGSQIKGMNFAEGEVDMDVMLAALKAAKDGEEPMNMEQVNQVLTKYFTVVKPAKDKEASEAFIADAIKNGAQTTASGLAYVLENAGDANAMPQLGDSIKVHYKGTLPNGDTFDSSYDRGEPATFPLIEGGLIQAWTEGMQLVGKGGKIILYVPSELGYGANGNRTIAPNQALKFEVELLDVMSATTKAE